MRHGRGPERTASSSSCTPDGTALCYPGTRTGWIGGEAPRGTPVLVDDDPDVYDRIVEAALTGRVLASA